MFDLKQGLSDRKVVRWSLAYLAGAWLLYEALSLVSQNFDLAPEFIRATTVVLIVGLPVAVVLAWYHGEKGRQRVGLVEAALLTVLLVAGSIGVIKVGRADMRSSPTPDAPGSAAADADPKSVAVLPFTSLSADKEDTYFAEGVQEQILLQLATLPQLKVISRTSVVQYSDGARDLGDIAKQLKVATVLVGTVRRADDRVRITARLINARTNAQLWAEAYDGTMSDVFAIQDSVAMAIAIVLRGRLTGDDADRITGPPTKNLAAYDVYARARSHQLLRASTIADDQYAAERLFEQAVQLDPEFALAYARLSVINAQIFWMAFDRSQQRLARAKGYAEKALALQPELPEAHFAMGYYYYYGLRDYSAAQQKFNTVVERVPGSSDAHQALAFIARRRGDWALALVEMERVTGLDPRGAEMFRNLGETFEALGRFEEADRAYAQAVALAPELTAAALGRAYLYVKWRGTTDSLRIMLQRAPASFEPSFGNVVAPRVWLATAERRYDDALAALAAFPKRAIDMQRLYYPLSGLAGQIYDLKGQHARARVMHDSARVELESRLRKEPDDPRLLAGLAITYASLGRREDAVAAAARAVHVMPSTRDAFDAPFYRMILASVYAKNGQADEAVKEIDALLRTPAGLTVNELRVDPRWDPIREHPGFKALLRARG